MVRLLPLFLLVIAASPSYSQQQAPVKAILVPSGLAPYVPSGRPREGAPPDEARLRMSIPREAELAPLPYPRDEEPQLYRVPARLALTKDMTIEGNLMGRGPLECTASFGKIAVPYDKLRGIAFEKSRPNKAKLFLENGDTLSVGLSEASLMISTEWGDAFVNTSHCQSVVLNDLNAKWSKGSNGQPMLEAVAATPPKQDPVPETTIRDIVIPRQPNNE